MLYQINDGTVSLGGNVILDHVDFEIRGTEKIAVVGANGAGKTTLLQVLSGELELDGDDKRMGPGITMSRQADCGHVKAGRVHRRRPDGGGRAFSGLSVPGYL